MTIFKSSGQLETGWVPEKLLVPQFSWHVCNFSYPQCSPLHKEALAIKLEKTTQSVWIGIKDKCAGGKTWVKLKDLHSVYIKGPSDECTSLFSREVILRWFN